MGFISEDEEFMKKQRTEDYKYDLDQIRIFLINLKKEIEKYGLKSPPPHHAKKRESRNKKEVKTTNKLTVILIIIGILTLIAAGVTIYLMWPKCPGVLNMQIYSSYAKKGIDLVGEDRVLEVYNPDVEQFVSLWLINGGCSDIFVEKVDFVLHPINTDPIDDSGQIGGGYGAGLIKQQQFKIEPSESKEIPLKFIFDKEYWKNSTLRPDSDISVQADITIYYRTKNKPDNKNIKKVFPVDVSQWSGFKEK